MCGTVCVKQSEMKHIVFEGRMGGPLVLVTEAQSTTVAETVICTNFTLFDKIKKCVKAHNRASFCLQGKMINI